MFTIISKGFKDPKYFRIAFYLLFFLSLFYNLLFFKKTYNIFMFYMLDTILLGLGFYNYSKYFLLFFASVIAFCRYYFLPDAAYFISYLLTHLLVMYVSVLLMGHYQKVKKGTFELIAALAKALDSRDTYTAHHSENVANVALKIARNMGLSKAKCDVVYQGGLLHDIGKIGIPEHILTKNCKLTDEEFEIIKNHSLLGYEIIKHIDIFNENGILDIVLFHHERYDGKGYPHGLKANQIPLTARIITVADAFDAMVSKRIYREGLDLNVALNEIRKNKGTQFDPEIVDAFLSIYENNHLTETK